MREGVFAVFEIEHRYNDKEFWVTSALSQFLFEGLNYQEARRAVPKGVQPTGSETLTVGDHYRQLLKPQNECWQQTGEHAGFLEYEDAMAALKVVRQCKRAVEDEVEFRLVVRGKAQFTEVLDQV